MESEPRTDLMERALAYAAQRGLTLKARLGDGNDGIVHHCSSHVHGSTAIKVFNRDDAFEREAACYRRLADRGVGQVVPVCGHAVPILLDQDAKLRVIEMTIVSRPFILDFASARLDSPPDFPPEVWAERYTHWQELFEDNWPRAREIITRFRAMGIYLLDPSPRNFGFPEQSD